MKSPIVKVLVLIVSLGLAGGYVWKTTRGKDGDTNSAAGKSTNQVNDKSPGEPDVTVSDEEVANYRNARMMYSSKSGLIMSDEDIREMIEKQKRLELSMDEVPADAPIHLAPSSKSPLRFLNPSDIDKLFDEGTLGPIESQEDK